MIISTFFLFLLVFPKLTLDASKRGLLLWFDTLLPTLLPFLILSQLILKTSVIDTFEKIFGPFFSRIFHSSPNGAFCILCGFLCGCPVGARLIALQLSEKKITLSEGQYLLSFCNNISPVFCISYGILYAIGSENLLPYLVIIYGSALFYGFIFRPKKSFKNRRTKKQTSQAENIFQLIDVCIIDSFLILIKLCGYLMIFSIICAGIFLFIPNSGFSASLIALFLEITGGLSYVHNLPKGLFRTTLSIIALSFGGLCCIFQTNSVISGTGLSLKKYIFDKAFITILSLCFFFLWHFFSIL